MKSIHPEELFTRRIPGNIYSGILQFPLVRIVVATLFLAVYLLPHNTLIIDAISTTSGVVNSILVRLDDLVSILVLCSLYRLYVKYVENRPAHELGLSGGLAEMGAGFGISMVLVGGMVLLLAALDFYRVDTAGSSLTIVDAVFRFGVGAFAQVLIFRLILLRLVEEWLGSWLAMIIVAAIFGMAHLANTNATLWTSVAIALSDVLLIASFWLTRRLWLVWGVHFGWNFFQDGIFGMPNSGETQFPSWLTATVDGPPWLTGGEFGIEASVVSVALNLILGLAILLLAVHRKQLVRPAWSRSG